jgi:hypothetical protein
MKDLNAKTIGRLKTSVMILLIIASLATTLITSKHASATELAAILVNPSQQDSWMYWGTGGGNGTVYEIGIDIVITDVTNMTAWQFGMCWSSSYLNCDSVTIHNPTTWTNNTISIDVTNGPNNSYNSTSGYFCYANCATEPPDFTGTLTIATLYFHQLTNITATTTLNLVDIELMDNNLSDIAFSSTDGSITMHTGVKSTRVTVTGNGSITELSPYPANRANWNCSQDSDGDASYVSSSYEDTNAYMDLYLANCSWIPTNASNILVTVHVVVRSTSTHRALCSAVVNATSTGMQYGSGYNPSTSYEDDSSSFNITQTDGGALQIGVRIFSAQYRVGGFWNYYPGYCTQAYAVITWS